MILLFYKKITDTISTVYNIDVNIALEFPWVFRNDDLYTSLLTINVESFKNRVFKSDDVSDGINREK